MCYTERAVRRVVQMGTLKAIYSMWIIVDKYGVLSGHAKRGGRIVVVEQIGRSSGSYYS